jgi:hypothetical protein
LRVSAVGTSSPQKLLEVLRTLLREYVSDEILEN